MNIEEFKKELSEVAAIYFENYLDHHKEEPEQWPVKDRDVSDWFEDFLCHLQAKGIIV